MQTLTQIQPNATHPRARAKKAHPKMLARPPITSLLFDVCIRQPRYLPADRSQNPYIMYLTTRSRPVPGCRKCTNPETPGAAKTPCRWRKREGLGNSAEYHTALPPYFYRHSNDLYGTSTPFCRAPAHAGTARKSCGHCITHTPPMSHRTPALGLI